MRMPMDDAAASDNCGEVTIEVSSETTAGDCDGSYTGRTFTHRRRQQHLHRTRPPTSVPAEHL